MTLRAETLLEQANNGWTLLPPSRPFPSLAADPFDIKTALRKNSKQELEAEVGSYRSIAGWKGKTYGEDSLLHLGIEGKGYFEMRQQGSKFPLLSTDGLLGIYGEIMRGLDAAQLRYTHISAHLSDGIYLQRQKIEYSREFFELRYAHQFECTKVYLGYQFMTHTIPVLPRHSAELGFYSIMPAHWHQMHPFFGADLRLRSVQEGTTYALSSGIAFVSNTGAPPLRISANYISGHDIRGQFYMEKLKKFSVGLELDI